VAKDLPPDAGLFHQALELSGEAAFSAGVHAGEGGKDRRLSDSAGDGLQPGSQLGMDGDRDSLACLSRLDPQEPGVQVDGIPFEVSDVFEA
jgi:hypothetical protein